jgi:choline kinase
VKEKMTMIIKEIIESKFVDFKGKKIKLSCHVADQCIDEPISKGICSSIDDYYNLMHLIKNSWTNTNYILKQNDAGYDIYSKNNQYLGVWIGVKEKSDSLFFIIYYDQGSDIGIWKKAQADYKGGMVVYNMNEDIWIYNEIPLSEIFKEDNEETQRKILTEWINKTTKKIL